MSQAATIHSDTQLELVIRLLRNFRDEGFRTRIEDDELKHPDGNPDAVLLQYGAADLREAANEAYRFHRWLEARHRQAKIRQDKAVPGQNRVSVPIQPGDGIAETGHA